MPTPQIMSQIDFTVKFTHVAIQDDGRKIVVASMMDGNSAYHEDEAYARKSWSRDDTYDTTGVELDLTALTQLDADGNAIGSAIDLSAGAGVNAIMIRNYSNDNELTLTQGALNGWNAGLFAAGANTDIKVGPGSLLVWGGGSKSYAVGGAAKTVKVAATANSARAWIGIIGDDA